MHVIIYYNNNNYNYNYSINYHLNTNCINVRKMLYKTNEKNHKIKY